MSVSSPHNHRTYHRNDPAQSAFRGAVSVLREEELVEIENDIQAFARTGIMSSMLSRILDTVDATSRQAA